MIHIETDNALEKASKMLAGIPNGIETALSHSMNRAIQEGRTAAVREATALYTAKARDVRSTFGMRKSSKSNLEAQLLSKGKNLPLLKYAHKPRTDTTGARRKLVKVGVKKNGLKPLGQGFIWQGRVMQRMGANRLPIEQKFGPAIPSILNNEQIVDKVVDKMSESVEKRLEHETQRLLQGYE